MIGMWIYTIPLWIGLPAFVLIFVTVSWGIVLALRSWVLRTSAGNGEWDRVLGYAVAVYGVFYGVTLAMIAAGAYANFSEVDSIVLDESSSIAVLYRDASGFPDPVRDELQSALVEYTREVVESDWPLQVAGEAPEETVDEVTRFQEALFAFEPETRSQTSLHNQTIEAFNTFVGDRRSRIAISELALPGVLWIVLAVGAALNAVLIGLIEVRSLRVHLIMSGLIAVFVALVIYAIANFDHAYAGPVAVGPGYFEQLLDGLLRDGSG